VVTFWLISISDYCLDVLELGLGMLRRAYLFSCEIFYAKAIQIIVSLEVIFSTTIFLICFF